MAKFNGYEGYGEGPQTNELPGSLIIDLAQRTLLKQTLKPDPLLQELGKLIKVQDEIFKEESHKSRIQEYSFWCELLKDSVGSEALYEIESFLGASLFDFSQKVASKTKEKTTADTVYLHMAAHHYFHSLKELWGAHDLYLKKIKLDQNSSDEENLFNTMLCKTKACVDIIKVAL